MLGRNFLERGSSYFGNARTPGSQLQSIPIGALVPKRKRNARKRRNGFRLDPLRGLYRKREILQKMWELSQKENRSGVQKKGTVQLSSPVRFKMKIRSGGTSTREVVVHPFPNIGFGSSYIRPLDKK